MTDQRGISVPLSRLGDRGVALMMVLWLVVFLSILALHFLREVRFTSAGTRNFKDETLAHYMAVSGYEDAVRYLLSDKDLSVDFIDQEGNFWIDTETETVTGVKTTEEGEVEIRIWDENARINLNFANTEQIRKLFQYAGIADDVVLEMIDAILDWKDEDDLHHPSGAENDYYEGLEKPYKAKNGPFDTPEELMLVKGMTREYFVGSDEVRPLRDFITTFGANAYLNINTVPKEVMEMLGLNEVEIEAVMKQRSKEAGGFRSAPQQFSSRGLLAAVANVLRIEVTARVPESRIVSKIVAVVSRTPGQQGMKIRNMYWSERAENIGS